MRRKRFYIVPRTDLYKIMYEHPLISMSINTPTQDEDPDERGAQGAKDFFDMEDDYDEYPDINLWGN